MILQNSLFRYVLILIAYHFYDPNSALISSNSFGILVIWDLSEFAIERFLNRN